MSIEDDLEDVRTNGPCINGQWIDYEQITPAFRRLALQFLINSVTQRIGAEGGEDAAYENQRIFEALESQRPVRRSTELDDALNDVFTTAGGGPSRRLQPRRYGRPDFYLETAAAEIEIAVATQARRLASSPASEQDGARSRRKGSKRALDRQRAEQLEKSRRSIINAARRNMPWTYKQRYEGDPALARQLELVSVLYDTGFGSMMELTPDQLRAAYFPNSPGARTGDIVTMLYLVAVDDARRVAAARRDTSSSLSQEAQILANALRSSGGVSWQPSPNEVIRQLETAIDGSPSELTDDQRFLVHTFYSVASALGSDSENATDIALNALSTRPDLFTAAAVDAFLTSPSAASAQIADLPLQVITAAASSQHNQARSQIKQFLDNGRLLDGPGRGFLLGSLRVSETFPIATTLAPVDEQPSLTVSTEGLDLELRQETQDLLDAAERAVGGGKQKPFVTAAQAVSKRMRQVVSSQAGTLQYQLFDEIKARFDLEQMLRSPEYVASVRTEITDVLDTYGHLSGPGLKGLIDEVASRHGLGPTRMRSADDIVSLVSGAGTDFVDKAETLGDYASLRRSELRAVVADVSESVQSVVPDEKLAKQMATATRLMFRGTDRYLADPRDAETATEDLRPEEAALLPRDQPFDRPVIFPVSVKPSGDGLIQEDFAHPDTVPDWAQPLFRDRPNDGPSGSLANPVAPPMPGTGPGATKPDPAAASTELERVVNGLYRDAHGHEDETVEERDGPLNPAKDETNMMNYVPDPAAAPSATPRQDVTTRRTVQGIEPLG